MVIFNSYVKLPKGMSCIVVITILPPIDSDSRCSTHDSDSATIPDGRLVVQAQQDTANQYRAQHSAPCHSTSRPKINTCRCPNMEVPQVTMVVSILKWSSKKTTGWFGLALPITLEASKYQRIESQILYNITAAGLSIGDLLHDQTVVNTRWLPPLSQNEETHND